MTSVEIIERKSDLLPNVGLMNENSGREIGGVARPDHFRSMRNSASLVMFSEMRLFLFLRPRL